MPHLTMADNDETLNSPARRVPKTSTLSISKAQQQKAKANEKEKPSTRAKKI